MFVKPTGNKSLDAWGKKRKIEREIFRSCSRQRQELNTEDEEATKDVEEGGSTEMVQSTSNQVKTEDDVYNLPELPAAPAVQNKKPGVIFILEMASLVPAYVGKKWKILYSEEDADFLLKRNKCLDDYRPDIMYEALSEIFDSPLNKAGMIGAVYVKIQDGKLFEIKPHVRIPRTLARFSGIMLELLDKSCIRAKDTGEILIRVIKEPVTRYLPENSRTIGLSYSSEKLVDINHYVSSANDDLTFVFVVGAMAHGELNKEDTEDFISVSNYQLSANCCSGVILSALERKWNI